MGIFSKQFIDVIEWTEPGNGILAFRYPMEDLEIQSGASLTVRESQLAVFVNEGRLADVFGPGRYTLTTNTLPVLTNLEHWDKGFASPFKSEVYFFSRLLQTDQRWGTSTPIALRDPEFGPLRVRAYGTYAYRVDDPRLVYQKLSGTRDLYQVADLEGQLRNLVVAQLSEVLAESAVPFLDMTAQREELSTAVAVRLRPVFAELGLALEALVVENLSLPEELQKTLDDRTSMNMLGDLDRYSQFQSARSIELAAKNEGGGAAGAGVGLGAGIAMSQNMLRNLTPLAAAVSGENKFCTQCGSQLPQAAKFCSRCGTGQA